MLLTSCVTIKTNEKVIVPELVFPIFPKLQEYEKVEKGVIVSDDYIIQLAEYKIMIEETEKNYNDIKSLYKEDANDKENVNE